MYFLRNSSTILTCGEVFERTRGYSNSRRCGVVPITTKHQSQISTDTSTYIYRQGQNILKTHLTTFNFSLIGNFPQLNPGMLGPTKEASWELL